MIHPNMFLNATEVDSIKAKKNIEPWKTQYDGVISNANIIADNLSYVYPNVVDAGSTLYSPDKHYYQTDAPYCGWIGNCPNGSIPSGTNRCCDGQVNPDADRADYDAAIILRNNMRRLGLAYQFTNDSKYAISAIKHIYTWCVDPNKNMYPRYTNFQSQIELSITIPAMFYGADLIWNYPNWIYNGYDVKQKLKEWTHNLVQSAKTWSSLNNFELWRIVLIASGAVITENLIDLNYAFDRFKYVLPRQMDPIGKMSQELHRTLSFTYSIFGLYALVHIAEIAKHHNVDLYNYKGPATMEVFPYYKTLGCNGNKSTYINTGEQCIELSLDYHAPYVDSIASWPCRQDSMFNIEYGIWELAYRFKQKDTYKDIIIAHRPISDSRIIGLSTLTHGLYLVTTICNTPISSLRIRST